MTPVMATRKTPSNSRRNTPNTPKRVVKKVEQKEEEEDFLVAPLDDEFDD